RRTFSEKRVLRSEDLVAEDDDPRAQLRHGRSHENLVIVASGAAVATFDVRHEDPEAGILHRTVRKTGNAAKLGAADLEPDEVIAVVHDAHGIGLRIADSQGQVDGSHGIGTAVPTLQNFRSSRCRTASGTSPETSPRSRAASLTSRLET